MGKGLRNDFNTEFDPENSNYNYSYCTQQEVKAVRRGRQNACVTNVTRLLLPSIVVIDFA